MKHLKDFNSYSINEKVDSAKIEKIANGMGKVRNNNLPKEVKSFLDTLSFAEGTHDVSDNHDDGYKILYGGEGFNDYSDHPRTKVSKGGYTSSAAGRYQFLSKTWDHIMKGKKFTPENQDYATVKLIKSKGAYDDIIKGDVESAVKKLAKTWASLPYSPYGQGSWYAYGDDKKLAILKDVYNTRLFKYGGEPEDKSTASVEKKADVMEQGDKGKGVETIQKALVSLGYELPRFGIDGKLGPETMKAIKDVSRKELNQNVANTIDRNIYKNILGLAKEKNDIA